MFAYCNNNPVNMYDSTGCLPKWIEKALNWVEEKVVQPVVDAAEKIIDYLSIPKNEIHYQSSATGNGATIVNSHTTKNPIAMYRYIQENRGDEIAGSTTGVVFEWVVHNAAYTAGKAFSAVGLKKWGESLVEKGQDLDVGQTIYDDSHGLASVGMWSIYRGIFPVASIYDLITELWDKE